MSYWNIELRGCFSDKLIATLTLSPFSRVCCVRGDLSAYNKNHKPSGRMIEIEDYEENFSSGCPL